MKRWLLVLAVLLGTTTLFATPAMAGHCYRGGYGGYYGGYYGGSPYYGGYRHHGFYPRYRSHHHHHHHRSYYRGGIGYYSPGFSIQFGY